MIIAPAGPYRWSLSCTMITASSGPYRWSLSRTMITASLSPHSSLSRSEEYSIPFPSYMDKKSYQCVVEDEMSIRNHNFDETTKLV